MEIEAEDFDVPQECYKTLETLLEKARKKINLKSRPKKILKCIAKILRKEGFKYKVGGLLSERLQTKEIDCMYYSLIYHSIGEELGLPISIVLVPDHVFVRWDDFLSWEATSSREKSNDYYIIWLNISAESISNGVYLKDLTREEAKSIAYDARANIKKEKKDLEGAIADFTKAIKLHQKDPQVYNNRGLVKKQQNKLREALADYDKALELDPNYVPAYNSRGIIMDRYGFLEKALADYDKAIELEPDFPEPYYNRGLIKKDKGDLKGAKKDFKMYEKLKKKEKEKENY